MTGKNFNVKLLNEFISKGHFETGFHYATDDELLTWFSERAEKYKWSKITDLEIIEERGGLARVDLVLKIIRPNIRIFTPGEIIRPVYFLPLPGRNKAPKLVPETTCPVKGFVLDEKGYQHLDVGLVSELNFVTSYETDEELSGSDKIHFCHPGRFELVA